MGARQLVQLRRVDEAQEVLRDGIKLARRLGDGHAASEMSEYLGTLEQVGE
jgi:hypothetical protein